MTLAHDTETDLSTLRFYVNGSLILSNSVTGNSLRPSLANKPLIIGGNTHNLWPNTTPTRLYGGWIDEARISTVQRSAAWLAASYRSQMPGSTLLDFGGLEPPLGTLLYLR